MSAVASGPLCRIAGVTHGYRGHIALDDLTLNLPAGRLVGTARA